MRGTAPITLTCLGTSDAFGSAGCHCAAYVVDTGHARLLFDAGPSVLGAFKGRGESTESVDAIVISHLHGDHFGGIPFLFLEYTYDSPRHRPLIVVGPPDTERRVFDLYRALYPESANETLPFEVRFVELDQGRVHDVLDARLEVFRVPHVKTGISLGLRVRSGGRSLVYSGDTAWTPDLIRESNGCDLFLCECTTFSTPIPGHVSHADIDRHRSSFECSKLLLTHAGREMRARAGEIADTVASDGLRIAIGGDASIDPASPGPR